MGGKTGTNVSQVQIPPEVLARYNSANAAAQQAASQPFQAYSTDPNAFVAPLTAAQQAGMGNIAQAQNIAQPYFQGATSQLMAGQQGAMPYYGAASQQIAGAQNVGQALAGQSLESMAGAVSAANPLQSSALGAYQGAYAAAQPYNAMALQPILSGIGQAMPLNVAAQQNILAGAQGIMPGQLGAEQINQYMSPYMGDVVSSTMANLRQQQQQEQSGLLGQQIAQGAFGGDRGRIAQANLARQQEMATGQTLANLLQAGYGQALGTAQQQQQLGFGAQQANRAALQQAAQQQMGLGQQLFGQGLAGGQAIGGIGGQVYSQMIGSGQNLAQLAQQLYAQGANTAQVQAALGQQLYGQGMGAAQQQAGLGQALYGMGAGTAQQLAGLGSQAQQNALAAAQAQLGAGTLQQQTEQAGKQALYQQFLQQQGYPFQTAQFLANIAMGTGALSGSTTYTQYPVGAFGAMARGGSVDDDNIIDITPKIKTESKGLAPESEGGAVIPFRAGQGFADGGTPSLVSDSDLAAILQAQAQALGLYGGGAGPYGMAAQAAPGLGGVVPEGGISAPGLVIANPVEAPKHQTAAEFKQNVDAIESQAKEAAALGKDLFGDDEESGTKTAAHGGLVGGYAAGGYAIGGMPYQTPTSYVPEEDRKKEQLQRVEDQAAASKVSGMGGGSGGGLSGLVQTGKDIGALYDMGSSLYDFASSFFSSGGVAGRHGYAVDGTVDDDQAGETTSPLVKDFPLPASYTPPPQSRLDLRSPEIIDTYSGANERYKQQLLESADTQEREAASGRHSQFYSDVLRSNAQNARSRAEKLGIVQQENLQTLPKYRQPFWVERAQQVNELPEVQNLSFWDQIQANPLYRYFAMNPSEISQSEKGLVPVRSAISQVDSNLYGKRGPGLAPPSATSSTPPAVPPVPKPKPAAAATPGLVPTVPSQPTATAPATAPVRAATPGLAPTVPSQPTATAPATAPAPAPAPAPKERDFFDRTLDFLAPQGGFVDRLSHGEEGAVVPFLTGLGAMARSRNITPFGAMLEGVGAGAEAYQPTAQAQIQRQISQAGMTTTPPGFIRAYDRTGKLVLVPIRDMVRESKLPPDQRQYSPVSPTGMPVTGQPGTFAPTKVSEEAAVSSPFTGVPKWLSLIERQSDANYNAMYYPNAFQALKDDPENKTAQEVISQYPVATANQPNLNQLAQSVSALGNTSGGPVGEYVIGTKRILNGLADAMGIPSNVRFGIDKDVTKADEQAKAAMLSALSTVRGANLTAARSLEEALTAFPSPAQTPEARRAIASTVLMASQQIKDLANAYMSVQRTHEDAGDPYPALSYAGTQSQFNEVMAPVYAKEKEILQDLLQPGNEGLLNRLIQSGGNIDKDKELTAEINRRYKNYSDDLNRLGLNYQPSEQIARYFGAR